MAESSGGRGSRDTIILQWPCVVALKSTRALLGVLAGRDGMHLRASWLGGSGAAQEGLCGQCAMGGHGREFWHLWMSHEAESSVFLLKKLESSPRIFQTVRHPALVCLCLYTYQKLNLHRLLLTCSA